MRLTIRKELPEDHRPYTDKYFLRSNEILKKEGLNPRVTMRVFARGEGKVAGLDEAVDVIKKYTDLKAIAGEVWVTKQDTYKTKDPLMIIKAPIQSIIELETMYLGVISHAISEAAGISAPNTDDIKNKMRKLNEIYGDIPVTYFGARHYHWSLDKQIAASALDSGAVVASTDIGASNIDKEGVGTIPHALILTIASKYGRDIGTVKTAELFDKYMSKNIPRVTLIDTFNKEITDSLMVAKYYGERKNFIRLDTCGENIGEGCSLYCGEKTRDPTYRTGTGVTIELITKVRTALIDNGYGRATELFLTSGFGNEEKAHAFVESNREFRIKTGYNLFGGVGIGEVTEARFCTGDIFEIDGKPFSKVGREVENIDYSTMRRVI